MIKTIIEAACPNRVYEEHRRKKMKYIVYLSYPVIALVALLDMPTHGKGFKWGFYDILGYHKWRIKDDS